MLQQVNALIKEFEEKIKNPETEGKHEKLFVGVDLGTAYIVLSVINEKGKPIAGAAQFAQAVRDGLVVDYMGAVDIVRRLKKSLEANLGVDLLTAGVAYPPGTPKGDRQAIRNVAEAAMLEVVSEVDEPTAANYVLGITNGAVVDIGGGTTGIAILRNGQVIYSADEPTGGTHLSLVISGAYKVTFEQAEKLKTDPEKHSELLPVVKPVIEKIASIIKSHIKDQSVERVYLVGGTCCLTGMEQVIEAEIKIPVVKPENPLFVTPLGIAISVKDFCRAM